MIAATALALYLCYKIALPFLASLVWALTLAVLLFPFYKNLKDYLKNQNLAAGLMTFLVAFVIVVPIYLIARQLTREVWRNVEYVRSEIENDQWRSQIEQNSYSKTALRWIETEVDVRGTLEQIANYIPAVVSGFLSGSIWIVIQFIITFFALFFFFRDHEQFLRGVRRLIPLSEKETDGIFKRVEDTLYATVFGEVFIAALQGILGGLMFWMLGLPAPVLWGFVIGLFGFIPVIGSWMVWLPAAVFLMVQGSWISGFVLLGWGILALTMLSNFLYPILVGERLNLHTLLVFVAIIGGVLTFGVVGLILGPLVLALTVSLIEIWKQKLDDNENIIVES